MRLKKGIYQMAVVVIVLVCTWISPFIQTYATENDEKSILLLSDCRSEDGVLDTMDSELFANVATTAIDYDYVLVDAQYVNQFNFAKLDDWMEQGVTLVYSFDDRQEAEEYLQNNIDKNINLYIKGCEFRGIFLNKENGIYSIGTIANAEFVQKGSISTQELTSDSFVPESYDKMEYLQGVIRNNLSNIDFSYQPDVKNNNERMAPSNSSRNLILKNITF